MSSRLSELVLNCRDPEALSRFWCAVLDYVELGKDDDGIEIGPVSGFGGATPTIILNRVEHAPTQTLRLHLDLSPVDRDQEAELERLLALGARPADVGQTGEESWHVLQDPEGNEFCLLRTRLDPL
ncbi:VOC family protein [Curtobacterium sp. P97]|uniref:VOC family protein n=1 Tax=Curtobacterium sp. P97 TaxID=2939562 RepID=UPI00203C5685|nr:VOC family protein [Curtobacterium sp. P97]MCM3523115.1 VOC family protein [Curtobacterium sp. P97]